MNAKKVALFGSSAVILAGALVYALGIYPPASSRDGQGAIGKRDVYRADQPADANVNPDAAPVAADANAKDVKAPPQSGQMNNGQVVALQNGQMLALQDGQMLAMKDGQMFAIQNGKMLAVKDGQVFALRDGLRVQMQSGKLLALQGGLTSGNFVKQMQSNNLNTQMNDR